MEEDVVGWLPLRKGHFTLESGHHGDVWIDLERLCLDPGPVERLAERLGARVATHHVDMICGPLIEGAFVALLMASKLGLPFSYAAPTVQRAQDGLFPVTYRIPPALRTEVRGRRVAIVNDVVNAGSAVRGTMKDLRACGATPIVIASLAVLGSAASRLAAEHDMTLECLVSLPNTIWAPGECPLCRSQVPLSPGSDSAE